MSLLINEAFYSWNLELAPSENPAKPYGRGKDSIPMKDWPSGGNMKPKVVLVGGFWMHMMSVRHRIIENQRQLACVPSKHRFVTASHNLWDFNCAEASKRST